MRYLSPVAGRLACVLTAFLLVLPARHAGAESGAIGKVIASFVRDDATTLILETRAPLVSGASVYVVDGSRATVGDKLSASTTPAGQAARSYSVDNTQVTIVNGSSNAVTAYYYSATIPGKIDVPQGSLVSPEPSVAPSYFQVKLEEHYTFESKKNATVTAIQGDRAMMNKGSLNEVHDRDIYKVYGSQGRYKGLLEMRGVGDFQSSGVLYNRLEDFHRDALNTQVGDKLIFAGQRKLFALGLLGGIRSSQETVRDTRESTFGGGLIWNVTAPDGWGLEILFGGFFRDGEGYKDNIRDSRSAKFIAPTWVKKNFFYPSVVSPFAAAGVGLFTGRNQYQDYAANIDQTSGTTTLVPVLGAGVEFFSGRFFRPRIEVRYLKGPKVNAGGNTFDNESIFYDFGFLTTW